MDAKYLSPIQVAEELQVSRTTVYELLRACKMPHRRVGRQYRVSRDDLQQYLDSVAVDMKGPEIRVQPCRRPPELRKLVKEMLGR